MGSEETIGKMTVIETVKETVKETAKGALGTNHEARES